MKRLLVMLLALPAHSGLAAMNQAPLADPVIVAAGDIACNQPAHPSGTTCRYGDTANLIGAINPVAVLPLGDLQYPSGALSDFNLWYDSTWGLYFGISMPTPGNHEYLTQGAAGYFEYFGSQVPGPYYSYDIGAWHLISLNSEIPRTPGSPEYVWLQQDLANHANLCTLAYWHKPRWSSGSTHGSDGSQDPLWDLLYAQNADLVLNGHEHNYERFDRLDGNGNVVPAPGGLSEIVAGVGGGSHYPFGPPITGSQFRNNTEFGLLELQLEADRWRWAFVDLNGRTRDRGTRLCH